MDQKLNSAYSDVVSIRENLNGWKKIEGGVVSWSMREEKIQKWIKNLDKESHILDIGAANGTLAHLFLSLGYRKVTFVDIDDYRSVVDTKELQFIRWNANAESLAVDDKTIDCITALQIFEHLENPWHTVRECSRVLKTGGTFIITIPHGFDLVSKFRFFLSGDIVGYEYKNNHISFLTHAIRNKLFVPFFTLKEVDYSRPFLKIFGKKLYFPDSIFFSDYLVEK